MKVLLSKFEHPEPGLYPDSSQLSGQFGPKPSPPQPMQNLAKLNHRQQQPLITHTFPLQSNLHQISPVHHHSDPRALQHLLQPANQHPDLRPQMLVGPSEGLVFGGVCDCPAFADDEMVQRVCVQDLGVLFRGLLEGERQVVVG